MQSGWLWSAAGRRVEHMPMPRPGQRIDTHVVPQGVMHTTEGSLSSALSVFRKHYAPTFTVAGHRIIQHIPLGQMAAALEHTSNPPTNGWARVQIEVVGFSKEKPWLPDWPTHDSLAHLMAALSLPNVASIPLLRPFVDVMPPPPWATPTFLRRTSGHWGHSPGWYGHVEIPENSHWDPGALIWKKVLATAVHVRSQIVHPHKHPKPHKTPRPRAIPHALRHRYFGGGQKVVAV